MTTHVEKTGDTAIRGDTPEGRLKLLKNGYEPLILNGKACYLKGWQHGEIDVNRLKFWENKKPHGGNTGLRTGRLVVFDIDIVDAEQAEAVSDAIQGVLGVTELERYGSKGVALCYRNKEEPLRKTTISGKLPGSTFWDKATPLVEILGQGQQMASFGLHPFRLQPYHWPLKSPLETHIDDLVGVTHQVVMKAASAARDVLDEMGAEDLKITGGLDDDKKRKVSPRKHGISQNKGGRPVSVYQLRNMLAFIDPSCDRNDWVGWLGAIKECPLSDEDFEDSDRLKLADEWSAGELNEDHSPGNYQGFDDVGEAFDSVGGYGTSLRTVASIIKEARDNGYAGQTRAFTAEEAEAMRPTIINGKSLVEHMYGLVKSPPIEDPVNDDEDKPQGIDAHIHSLDGFLEAVKPREFAIDRWLPAKGLSFILAKRGTGKSAILTDLACRVATDCDWHGVKIDATRTVAIYLCGEDSDGLALNLRAWREEHGIDIDPSRLIVADMMPQIKNPGEAEAWAKALKRRLGDRRAIVILDTWQRATSSAKSQSEETDIAAALANAEYLGESLDAPVLAAAHPPKGAKEESDLTVMGSSLAENQAVAIWTLWDDDNSLRLKTTKVRGARTGGYHILKIRGIPLAGERQNNFGNAFEGLVIDYLGGTADPNDTTARLIEMERNAKLKSAYAMMVRHLLRWSHTDEACQKYGADGLNPTQNALAEEAERQMAMDYSYLKEQWAATASEVGLSSFKAQTIRKGLATHLRPGLNRPSTHDFDDGLQLKVTRKGRTDKAQCTFQIVNSPIMAARKLKEKL